MGLRFPLTSKSLSLTARALPVTQTSPSPGSHTPGPSIHPCARALVCLTGSTYLLSSEKPWPLLVPRGLLRGGGGGQLCWTKVPLVTSWLSRAAGKELGLLGPLLVVHWLGGKSGPQATSSHRGPVLGPEDPPWAALSQMTLHVIGPRVSWRRSQKGLWAC